MENTWKWQGEECVIMPPKITTDMSSVGRQAFCAITPYEGIGEACKESDVIITLTTEVAAGKKAGRDNDTQRIICQLVGMGSLDLGVATLAYERITASDEDYVEIDMMG